MQKLMALSYRPFFAFLCNGEEHLSGRQSVYATNLYKCLKVISWEFPLFTSRP